MGHGRWVGRMVTVVSALLLLAVGLAAIASGGTPGDEAAIKGYDPVAYFSVGKAMKGDGAFTFQWRGMTWHFVSRENRDLFAASPEYYAPQYDGYCAWAMTEARKAVTDPEFWRIVNGKLYLNCSRQAFDKWSRDIPGNIEKADRNWLKMSGDGKDGKPY